MASTLGPESPRIRLVRGFAVTVGVGEGVGVEGLGVAAGVGAVEGVGAALSDGVGVAVSDSAVVAVSEGVEVTVSGEGGAGEVVDGVVLSVGVDAASAAGVQETSNDPQPASSNTAAVSAAAAVARVLLVRPIRPLRPVHWRNHRPPAEGMRVGVRQSTRRS